MCVRASMKAAKPLHIVLATNPNPTRARGYPLNINPKPDPKPDSISGPAGSGRVADLYRQYRVWIPQCAAPLDVTVTYARDSFVDSPAGPFVFSRGGPDILDVTVTYARDSFCGFTG